MIVEELGDETLIYDEDKHQAYVLTGAARASFRAAKAPARRAVLAAALGAGALTLMAPFVAEAASCHGAVQRCGRGDIGRECAARDGQCGRCFDKECVRL